MSVPSIPRPPSSDAGQRTLLRHPWVQVGAIPAIASASDECDATDRPAARLAA